MVKSTIEIPENENRVLNIVKAKYGLRSKEEAFIFLINEYGKNLEPELRPEYLEKLEKIRQEKGISFKDIKDLRRKIEGA